MNEKIKRRKRKGKRENKRWRKNEKQDDFFFGFWFFNFKTINTFFNPSKIYLFFFFCEFVKKIF
jgi:hypothetical protein